MMLSASSLVPQYGQTPFSGVIATYIGYLVFIGLAVVGYVSSVRLTCTHAHVRTYVCTYIHTHLSMLRLELHANANKLRLVLAVQLIHTSYPP